MKTTNVFEKPPSVLYLTGYGLVAPIKKIQQSDTGFINSYSMKSLREHF